MAEVVKTVTINLSGAKSFKTGAALSGKINDQSMEGLSGYNSGMPEDNQTDNPDQTYPTGYGNPGSNGGNNGNNNNNNNENEDLSPSFVIDDRERLVGDISNPETIPYQQPAPSQEYDGVVSDMTPPANLGLINRGIDILRPYILLILKYLPITSGEQSSVTSNLSLKLGDQNFIKVNQVLRLIELHRSVNKVVKITSSKIINQSVLIDKNIIVNTLRSPDIQNFNYVDKYNQITGETLNEEDFLKKAPEVLTANNILIAVDKIMDITEFDYHVFRVIDVEGSTNFFENTNTDNLYDTILNNAISKFSSFQPPMPDVETIDVFIMKLLFAIARNNSDFREDITFKKIIEVAIIKKLLKKFKSFVVGAYNLQDEYRNAIDLGIMSNSYGPISTLSSNKGKAIAQIIQNVTSISTSITDDDDLFIDTSSTISILDLMDEDEREEWVESLLNTSPEDLASQAQAWTQGINPTSSNN